MEYQNYQFGRIDDYFPILKLPKDIISQIFGLLNQLDVIRLSKVNKALHTLGLAKLYHSVFANNAYDCIEIAIWNCTYTPFYIKYTIINSVPDFIKMIQKRGPNIQLIKEIVLTSAEPGVYKTLKKELPSAVITLEYETDLTKFNKLDISDVTGMELNTQNYRVFNNQVTDVNHSIKQLSINYESVSLLGLISNLQGLETLTILSVTRAMFNKLHTSGISNLKIKRLFLENCSRNDSNLDLYSGLNPVFNLESIETFGFRPKTNFEYPDLPLLINNLSNLSRLFLHGKSNTLYRVAISLRPNSLSFLCLNDIAPSSGQSNLFNYDKLMRFIGRQEKSLRKLCIVDASYHFMGNECVDRISKFEPEYEYRKRVLYHELVEQILDDRKFLQMNRILDERKFLQLNTILLNNVLSLLKVNKALHTLGLAKLYHSIYFNDAGIGTEIAISIHMYTPFFLRYTVINSIYDFMRMIKRRSNTHLIKEIVVNSPEPDGYGALVNLLPSVAITLEYVTDLIIYAVSDISAVKGMELNNDNYQIYVDKLTDTNHSIKHLTITYESSNLLWIINGLEALESITISPVTIAILDELKYLGISNLKLKELFLENCSVSGSNLYRDLKQVLKLDSIETFGFSPNTDSEYPNLELLIPHLSNLRCLFLHGRSNTLYRVAIALRPNSLSFLCLHDTSSSAGRSNLLNYDKLMRFISRQEKSLRKLCISGASLHLMGHVCIDCVYVDDPEEDYRKIVQYHELVEQISDQGKFPQLHTIFTTGYFPLLKLPNEIITRIFGLLNQIDVLSFSKVNKALYTLGLAKLYHSVYINNSSDCSEIAIWGYIYTPFYIKYTIINSIDSFITMIQERGSNIHLIKEIVINSFKPAAYEKLIMDLPWVAITLEYETDLTKFNKLDTSDVTGMELNAQNYHLLNNQVTDINYSIKQLDTTYFSTNLLGLISSLQGLETISISQVTTEILNKFLSSGISNLKIKGLFLENCARSESNLSLYLNLTEIFDLESIETFGFRPNTEFEYSDLPLLITNLPNLKRLFLYGISSTLYRICTILPPNSITFLCLHDTIWLPDRSILFNYENLMKLIGHQEKYLRTLCISDTIFHYMGNGCVDRIYKYEPERENRKRVLYYELVEQILNEGKFPQLNTIMLNNSSYFIKRYISGSIEIIPGRDEDCD
ncbi:hypothetical protein JA1_004673 [Spathaspora sp. JA1]|nr:hypothetical protein JA1_004673 [Spathaspora sp. JA1]